MSTGTGSLPRIEVSIGRAGRLRRRSRMPKARTLQALQRPLRRGGPSTQRSPDRRIARHRLASGFRRASAANPRCRRRRGHRRRRYLRPPAVVCSCSPVLPFCRRRLGRRRFAGGRRLPLRLRLSSTAPDCRLGHVGGELLPAASLTGRVQRRRHCSSSARPSGLAISARQARQPDRQQSPSPGSLQAQLPRPVAGRRAVGGRLGCVHCSRLCDRHRPGGVPGRCRRAGAAWSAIGCIGGAPLVLLQPLADLAEGAALQRRQAPLACRCLSWPVADARPAG